jgi:hypothetical protein
MKIVGRIALAVLTAALLLPAVAAACPNCKDAVADGEYPGGAASLGHGFYYSILLMIAVPWTAVLTVAFLIYRKQCRLKLERSEAQP